MPHSGMLWFEISFIGYVLVVVASFVLAACQKITHFHARLTLNLPLLLMLGAVIAGEYPQSARIAPVMALSSFVPASIVVLSAVLNEWLKRRSQKTNQETSKNQPSEVDWPPRPLLTSRAGFIPKAVSVTAQQLYINREVITVKNSINDKRAKRVAAKCRAVLASNAPAVTIEINSGGGQIDAAWNMREHVGMVAASVDTFAVVVGECCSAAMYILLALPLERRFATSHSQLHFHRGSYDGITVVSHPHLGKKRRLMLELGDKRYLALVAEKTGVDSSSLEAAYATDQEVYLTAQQALELGIIGGIVEA